MSPRTPPTPTPTGMRRRVIVELTAEELPLLEAAERRYATKRQAVVAALAALAEAPSGRHERAGGSAGPDPGEAVRHETERAEAERALAELRRERDALALALERTQAERAEALAAAKRLDHRLERSLARLSERAEAEQEALDERIAALVAERPTALYCARCERWAPEAEWAWRSVEAGEEQVAHHARCGDHGPGLLGVASWLARREGPQGQKPTR